MTLLTNEQKIKLQELYNKKKFAELELEIEFISDFKTRSPFLANLLGVAKLRKISKTEKDWSEARNLFLDAHRKDPNYIDALCNYAHLSVKLRDYEVAYTKLMDQKKRGYNPKINEALARIYFFEGEIDKELDLFKENEKNGDLTHITASHLLTSMNYSSNFDQKNYLEYCKKIDEKFKIPNDTLNKLIKFDYGKNLKVGFLSPDFKEHSVYYFLKSTIDNLKNNSINVTAFNIRETHELDSISQQIEKQCNNWVDLSLKTDFEAANEIRKNKINILIDISGHFARNRFTILKYKPAPIQISWMGFVNTTGIKEMDYILIDPYLIKNEEENLYSETVIRMPNIWNCHMGIQEKITSNEPPFLKNGYLTFGCFNNSTKISNKCIDTWSEILNRIDDCKLIIKASSKDSEIAQKKILDKFKKKNVDEKKIIFEQHKKEKLDHLKMYHNIDVSLDTFPYPGVTTSFESIWMGVPVLTKRGNNFVSRCGESINLNLGLNSFLADNDEDYINKAVAISENRNEITKIRSSLRKKSLKSPLFDTEGFGRNFSNLMKKIWKEYKAKNKIN